MMNYLASVVPEAAREGKGMMGRELKDALLDGRISAGSSLFGLQG